METTEVINDSNHVTIVDDNLKTSRKAGKKASRALQILKKDTGLQESEDDTNVLFICNAGLVTGCASSDLVNIFTRFGPIQSVIMIPHKSYSFVMFFSKDHARQAMAAVHGKVGLNDRGPLYLAFVDHPSEFDDPWSDPQSPIGLEVVRNFVTEEEELELLSLFDWDKEEEIGHLKHRQVKHFGYEFSYKTNNIDPTQPLIDSPIPPSCIQLVERAIARGIIGHMSDQLTVNRYLPGQGIPTHIDTHSCCSETILSVSLGSSLVMDMKSLNTDQTCTPVWLPARSMLVLSGPARYTWSHGITPKHIDTVPGSVVDGSEGLTLSHRDTRVSLTFRQTIRHPCNCQYPAHCDSQTVRSKQTPERQTVLEMTASRMETQLVHQVYEEIAGHFSATRYKPWPKVVEFLMDLHDGVILDLGCGNGKYLGSRKGQLYEVGADYSQNLLNIVRERGHQALRCDLLAVPVKDNTVSGLICIAALHHLATEDRRVSALREMCRVLEPDGQVLVYVWAKDQGTSHYRKNKDEEAIVGQTGEFGLPVHKPRTQFQHQDVLVPWKLKEKGGEKEFKRYYHVFEEGELEGLIEMTGGLKVVRSYYDQGNWCVVASKC